MNLRSAFFSRCMRLSIAVLVAPTLWSCNAMPGLSGAASMQVEVEVYKGPLSFEREIQIGSLYGTILSAQGRIEDFVNFASEEGERIYCDAKGDVMVEAYGSKLEMPTRNPTDKDYQEFELLRTMCETDHEISRLGHEISRLDDMSGALKSREFAQQVARVSGLLRDNAAYLARSLIVYVKKGDDEDRKQLIDFSAYIADLSNVLKSKSDALLKSQQGTAAKDLSLATHLRDASPTEYLQLYRWFSAMSDRIPNETLDISILWSQPEYMRDRVRAIEALYNDDVWANVNTAYASGAGDVSMAFIKDDIGNWNLKKFDNDPSKLLDAYKRVGQAALGTAVQIATKGIGGRQLQSEAAMRDRANGTTEALAIADRVAFGGGANAGPAKDNPMLTRFHATTSKRLEDLKLAIEDELKGLPGKIEQATNAEKQQQVKVDEAKTKVSALATGAPPNTALSYREEAKRKEGLAEADETEASLAVQRVDNLNRRIKQEVDAIQVLSANNCTRSLTEAESRELDARTTELNRLRVDVEAAQQRRDAKADSAKRLRGEANADLANAIKRDKIEADMDKLRAEIVTPAEAKLAELKAETIKLQAKEKGGLYKEMIEKARQIIDEHRRFIDEIEALQAPPASPTAVSSAAGVAPTATPTVPSAPPQPPALSSASTVTTSITSVLALLNYADESDTAIQGVDDFSPPPPRASPRIPVLAVP